MVVGVHRKNGVLSIQTLIDIKTPCGGKTCAFEPRNLLNATEMLYISDYIAFFCAFMQYCVIPLAEEMRKNM